MKRQEVVFSKWIIISLPCSVVWFSLLSCHGYSYCITFLCDLWTEHLGLLYVGSCYKWERERENYGWSNFCFVVQSLITGTTHATHSAIVWIWYTKKKFNTMIVEFDWWEVGRRNMQIVCDCALTAIQQVNWGRGIKFLLACQTIPVCVSSWSWWYQIDSDRSTPLDLLYHSVFIYKVIFCCAVEYFWLVRDQVQLDCGDRFPNYHDLAILVMWQGHDGWGVSGGRAPDQDTVSGSGVVYCVLWWLR